MDQARWPEAAQMIIRAATTFAASTTKQQDEVALSVIGDLLRRYAHGLFSHSNTMEEVFRSRTLDAHLYPERYEGHQPPDVVTIVRDHMVPLAEIAFMVLHRVRATQATYAPNQTGAYALGELIRPYLKLTEVLKEEDGELTAAGFRERMPDGSWQTGGRLDARYQAAGVKLVPIATGYRFSPRRYMAQRGMGAREIWTLRLEQ